MLAERLLMLFLSKDEWRQVQYLLNDPNVIIKTPLDEMSTHSLGVIIDELLVWDTSADWDFFHNMFTRACRG